MLCLMDATVTLMGQPDQYWSDGFSKVNEANPAARFALSLSPMHFAIEQMFYIAFWCGIILLGHPKLAFVVSLWVTIVHLVGTFYWVYLVFRWNYFEVSALFFIVSLMLSLCWFRSGYFAEPNAGGQPATPSESK